MNGRVNRQPAPRAHARSRPRDGHSSATQQRVARTRPFDSFSCWRVGHPIIFYLCLKSGSPTSLYRPWNIPVFPLDFAEIALPPYHGNSPINIATSPPNFPFQNPKNSAAIPPDFFAEVQSSATIPRLISDENRKPCRLLFVPFVPLILHIFLISLLDC
jgi:hypothetical protein